MFRESHCTTAVAIMHLLVPLLLFVFVDPGIESTDYTCCHKDNGKHRCYSEWLPEVCNEWYFVRCLQNTSELKAMAEDVI